MSSRSNINWNQLAHHSDLSAARASAFLYDKSCEAVRRYRQRTRDAFVAFVQIMAVEDGLEIGSTSSQAYRFAFCKSRIVGYVCQYLKFLAIGQEIAPTGMIEEKIKAQTLSSIGSALWFFAQWELGYETLAVFQEWHLFIPSLIHKLAVDEDLGSSIRSKEYFGVPELRLFFLRLVKEPFGMNWWKQMYVCWTVLCIIGARPSSLCAIAYGKENTANALVQTLRWKDIEFINDFDALAVRITLRFVKGRRDPHKVGAQAKLYRPAQFLIKSCTKAQNLHADLPWLLFALAYERQLFGRTPWKDVFESSCSRLLHDPGVTNRPVFVTCNRKKGGWPLKLEEPIYANRLNPPLKAASREVGLCVYVTTYVWRREALTAVARNLNAETAKQVAIHANGNESFSHYDYGFGDMDVGQIRLGEFQNLQGLVSNETMMRRLRNETRMLLAAPAVVSLQDYSISEEKAFIRCTEEERQDTIARRPARLRILTVLREKFKLSAPLSYPGTFEALQKLNDGYDVPSKKIDDSLLNDNDAWVDAITEATSPAETIGLLKGFRRAHLSHLVWLREGLQREFRKKWLDSKAPASREDVKKQARMAVEPVIDALKLPSHVSEARKMEKAAVLDKITDPGDILESKLGEWDGIIREDVSDDMKEDGCNNDVDEEVDVEEKDPLRTFVNSFPDDEDILIDVEEPEGAATASEGIDQHLAGKRMELLTLWMSWSDQYRGRQTCPFCQADASGRVPEDCRHAMFGSTHFHNKHANYDSSYLPDNYTALKRIAPVPPTSGRRSGGGTPWHCRLCKRKFRIQGDMIEHYRTEHAEFCYIL